MGTWSEDCFWCKCVLNHTTKRRWSGIWTTPDIWLEISPSLETLDLKIRGVLKFADGIKPKIVGIGNVDNNNSDLITDVMLVEGLTHNLLSISKFCDQGYRVVFEPSRCIIKDSTLDKIILTRLYLDDLINQNVKCLASFVNEKWMWHKKLGHAHMRLIFEISQKKLVKG